MAENRNRFGYGITVIDRMEPFLKETDSATGFAYICLTHTNKKRITIVDERFFNQAVTYGTCTQERVGPTQERVLKNVYSRTITKNTVRSSRAGDVECSSKKNRSIKKVLLLLTLGHRCDTRRTAGRLKYLNNRHYFIVIQD